MKLNLALYKRAILTDSRKFVLYGAWLAMSGFLFIELYGYNSFSGNRGAAEGLEFLKFVTYTNFVFITLAGILGFSSAVTEEKEEDCLGLLIMTGISPVNLLTSKMLARYTRGLFLLLSQVPFIIMAVTLGGVSINQIIATYTVLLSFMFLLCSLGTLVSLLFSTTRKASTITFAILATYLILIAILLEERIIPSSVAGYFLPFIAMERIFRTGFSEYFIPEQFFGCVIMGVMFFYLAVRLFDKFALRKASEGKAKSKAKLGLFKRGRPWSLAIFWKEFTFNLSGRKGWTIQGFIYFGIICTIVYFSDPYERGEFLLYFLAFSSFIFSALILAVSASAMFSSEFRDGTHTSLFTLPCDLSYIFWSKLFGGILYAFPSILLSISLFLYIAFENFSNEYGWVFVFLSYVLVYVVLSGYMGLLMRIGGFVASGAILFLFWVMVATTGFGGMGEEEVIFLILFLNGLGSVAVFFLGRNKLLSMIEQ